MFDFDDLKREKRLGIFLVFVIIFLFSLYFYLLMFGNRSFSQMVKLESDIELLQQKVDKLRKENVVLQKKYFELKELEGSE